MGIILLLGFISVILGVAIALALIVCLIYLMIILFRKINEKAPENCDFISSGDTMSDTKNMMKFLGDRMKYVGSSIDFPCSKRAKNFASGDLHCMYILTRLAHAQGLKLRIYKKRL